MASLQLYIQKMFADMQTAMGSMQTDMGGLVTKLDDTILELQNINTSVAQTLVTANIKAGSTNSFVLNAADVTSQVTAYSKTVGVVAHFKTFCNGLATINFKIKGNSAGTMIYLGISTDGGTTFTQLASMNGLAYQSFSKVINLTALQDVYISLINNDPSKIATCEAGADIKYDYVDIANDGPFGAA